MINPQGKAVIVSAPSGSGKTTLVKHLININSQLGFSISACTRSPRDNESNGRDYFFLSDQEFQDKIEAGDFIEWEEVYTGVFYGTIKSEIERIWNEGKHVIFDVDVEGGLNLKEYFGLNAMAIFVKAPSEQALIDRLTQRGTETDNVIRKRVKKARYEEKFADQFDHVIVNDDLEEASKQIQDLYLSFISN